MTKKTASLSSTLNLWRGWEIAWERLWQAGFGSPDLGAVDFRTLTRRKSPNDALICPKDVCPAATPDREPPVFALPAARLRRLVAEIALWEPNTSLLQSGPEQDRYLVRTRLMRFPDTVVVQVIARGEERSTLALYSRSQVGRSDFGVNRRRLEHWLSRIAERTGAETR